LALTASTTTIDPSTQLTRDLTTGEMQGAGGADELHQLRIEVAPPVISWENRAHILANTCVTACGTEAEPINIPFNGVHFKYEDIGSGLASATIQAGGPGGATVYTMPSDSLIYTYEETMDLPDGKYFMTVTDGSRKPTTMWFRVDPVSPRVDVDHIDMSQDFSTFSIYGVVQDTGSGMDFLALSRNDALVKIFDLAPGTTAQTPFSATGLGTAGDGYYVLSAQDRIQNLTTPQPLAEFTVMNTNISGSGESGRWDDHRSIGQHVTGISVWGSPCTVTVSATPSTLAIPVNYSTTTNSITVTLTSTTTEPVPLFSGSEYMDGSLSVETSTTACTAQVQGQSVSGLLLGPKTSVARNTEVPEQLDVTYNYGLLEALVKNLQFVNGETPGMTAESAPASAPEGDFLFPPELGRGWELKYTGITYDSLRVRQYGLPPGLTEAERSSIRMLERSGSGSVTDITTGHADNYVEGETHSNSVFMLAAPISLYDKTGPDVSFAVSRAFLDNNTVYVSSSASVTLSAKDTSASIYVLAGVASTYYLLDVEPTSGCLATAYNPGAAPGSCENPLYTGPFEIAEGTHSLSHWAVDNIGNIGLRETMGLRVDGTAPESVLEMNGTPITPGTTVYATTADTITLSGADIMSNGVISGLSTTYFLVDISTEECDYSDWDGGVNGMGTCENQFYGGPFSLSEGDHVIYYLSQDNVGNLEPMETAYITVEAANSSLDTVPPTVTASVHGQVVADSATVVMASTDAVTLAATDEGSGLLGIYYTVDTVPSSTTATTYTAPFTLAAGTHMVYYTAVDKAGNQAAVKTFVSYIPKTYTWSGFAGDGNWYTAGNWRENAVPGAIDTAVLATRDTILVTSPALRVHDVILGDADGLSAPILKISTGVVSSGTWTLYKNATLEQSTTEQLIVGTLLMQPGSVVSHTQNTTTRRYAVNLKAVNDLTMLAGSSIAVDGLGYAGGNLFSDGYGPGRGRYALSYGSGGGHGGSGASSRGTSVGGPAYDSLLNPADLGSGGAGGSGDLGGGGGGAVALEAGGQMTLDGVISVNGTACAGDYCGGGAGGSINLNSPSLKGTGSLRANGGTGSSFGGGGAGGRIGINAAVLDNSGLNLAANSAGGGSGYGGAGTIYLNSNGGAQLIVSNNANLAAYQTTISSAIAGTQVLTISTLSMTNAQLAFDGNVAPLITANASFSGTNSLAVSSLTLISNFAFAGATLQQQSTTTLTFIGNLTMQNGSKITSAANPGGSRLYAVNLNVTGNMDIGPGAVIDVSSLGYAGGVSGGAGAGLGGGAGGLFAVFTRHT